MLTLAGWKLTQGKLSKVDASLKEIMPELGFAAEPISGVEPLQRPLLGQFLLGSWGHELLAECDG